MTHATEKQISHINQLISEIQAYDFSDIRSLRRAESSGNTERVARLKAMIAVRTALANAIKVDFESISKQDATNIISQLTQIGSSNIRTTMEEVSRFHAHLLGKDFVQLINIVDAHSTGELFEDFQTDWIGANADIQALANETNDGEPINQVEELPSFEDVKSDPVAMTFNGSVEALIKAMKAQGTANRQWRQFQYLTSLQHELIFGRWCKASDSLIESAIEDVAF